MGPVSLPDDGIQGFSRRALKVLVSGQSLPPEPVQHNGTGGAQCGAAKAAKVKHRRSRVRGDARSSMRKSPLPQKPRHCAKKKSLYSPSRSRSSKARREKKRTFTLSLPRETSKGSEESFTHAAQQTGPILPYQRCVYGTSITGETLRQTSRPIESAKVVKSAHRDLIGVFGITHDRRCLAPSYSSPLVAPKPRLPSIGQPPVWADTRQELCEGLPYFRAFQSGLYSHHNVAIGYLLDGFGSSRDYIGGKVIVSHGGGKGTLSFATGLHELADDQSSMDRSVSALLNNYRQQQPLVLIMGSKATSAPAVIPHRYCVLDWFRISHCWTERESEANPNIRYKFRFEKLSSGDGWWSAPCSESKDEYDSAECMQQFTCDTCNTTSTLIYQVGICLNQSCAMFWHLRGHFSDELILNESCKKFVTVSNITPPCALKPPVMESKSFYNGGDVSRVCWRAFCCPDCGKLNSRVLFDRWQCSACGHTIVQEREVHSVAEVRDAFRPVYTGPPTSFDWLNLESTLQAHVSSTATMKIMRYSFGDDVGSVYHISCANTENASADKLFEEYQTQKIDFCRRLLKTRVEGYFLSAQFSHNAGVQYKYHAETGTEPFEQCAPVISSAKDLITERVAQALGQVSFNEVLSVAYFEGQHMNYHDDGEPGVAPVVASLSLGSVATMKFRPKKGQDHLFFNKVLRSFNPTGADRDTPEPEEDVDEPATGKLPRRDVLRLYLEHGDVMIMHGENFQKLVEHAVVPKGFRIAATARYIS